MAGEPLNAVEIGVHKMLSSLKRNPYALETVHMSVISFAAKAKILATLSEINAINPPNLSIRPGTSLGAALNLLRASIEKEVTKTTAQEKGDYRPLAFILTDGQPTDDWRGPTRQLRETRPSLASVYGIGCGNEVDFETLGQIADVCFQVDALTPESLGKLFVWLTASIQSASVNPEAPLTLEKNVPLEKGMQLIDKDRPPKFQEKNTRLYFHVACQQSKKHYMMRYRFIPERGVYFVENTFPLPEDFFSDGSLKAPAVDSNLLYGEADCPYCHSLGWGKCGFCGHLFCLDPDNIQPQITCPFCETSLTLSDDNESFSVDGSVG
jgi:uncharacterized protein YegL